MKNTAFGFLLFLIVVIAVAVWRFSYVGNPVSPSVERTKILMDTLVRIEVFGENEETAHEAIEGAFDEIERISGVFSRYLPESDVSRLSDKAGGPPEVVSEDLYTALERSLHFSKVTDGAFDITVGAISTLWDFTGEEVRVPLTHEVEERLGRVDYRRVVMEGEHRVGLADSGMAIDLGGVGKGYAVDRALEVLKENGVTSALVDAGGDIGLLGSKSDGTPWRIGVQHPRDPHTLAAIIDVDSGSVATSGDYQRFTLVDGRRYHHILDPKTGWPSQRCISATVVTQRAMDADILATAVFVLGPERGMAVVESLSGVEGLILFEDESKIEHVVSHGLRDRVAFN